LYQPSCTNQIVPQLAQPATTSTVAASNNFNRSNQQTQQVQSAIAVEEELERWEFVDDYQTLASFEELPGTFHTNMTGPINIPSTANSKDIFELYWGAFLDGLIVHLNEIIVRTGETLTVSKSLFLCWIGVWVHQMNTYKREIKMYWQKGDKGEEGGRKSSHRHEFLVIFQALYHINKDMLQKMELELNKSFIFFTHQRNQFQLMK